jgi:hypothetical protein
MRNDGLSFEDHVRPDELDHVARSRADADQPGISAAQPLAGLALSGGGIRSATFNLGILQAMAEARKLREFDYLSTVSGGGYVGGWLTAWIHRRGLDEVETALADSVNGKGTEPHEVRWLRAHSNYLTPRKGLLSLDTLWGMCTYLRNLVTNQFLLIALIVLVLAGGAMAHVTLLEYTQASPQRMWIAGAVLLLLAAPIVGFEFAHLRGQSPRPWIATLVCKLREGSSHWIIAILSLGGATLMAYALLQPSVEPWGGVFAAFWIIAAVAVPIAFRPPQDANLAAIVQPKLTWIVWLAMASALFAVLERLYGEVGRVTDAQSWLTPLIGPALFITAFELCTLVLIMLSGRALRPFAHDWLSRMAAVMILLSVLPFAVFASWVLLAPTIDYLLSMARILLTSATQLWVISTISGVLGGKSKLTGSDRTNVWAERALAVTPFIFLLGLFTLLVWATREILLYIAGVQAEPFSPATVLSWTGALRVNLQRLDSIPFELWWQSTGVLLLLAMLLAWRIDINLFSFHAYYRNRLAHAYLGASATNRKANAFTGYAPGDSPTLQDLVVMEPGKRPIRPYPLLNTALNLSGQPRMEWQQRKAASFVFSPLYCGFQLPAPLSQRRDFSDCPSITPPTYEGIHAHRKTADFIKDKPGRDIGHDLAITISGAAASPNMGYHTAPTIAALMTAFNVRLGWWLPNPKVADAWAKGGPAFSTAWMVKELTANANEEDRFVYLSDGGHFENLGVYELLRRRCKLIVASDATADALFRFDDLANLVHKARADFGIEIDADALEIRPVMDAGGVIGSSKSNFLVARISYPPLPGNTEIERGWLVYLKSSLPAKLPADVENYRWANPGFPHQATADQWFDETQFEAYRKLGLEIGRVVTARLGQGFQ